MSTHHRFSPDDEAFLQAFVTRIEFTYREALRRGVEDPAVLMIDPSDESAAAIAKAAGLSDVIAGLLGEGRRRGKSLLLTHGTARARAVELLARGFPDVAAEVALPNDRAGSYPVIVVSGGAAVAA